MFDIILTFSISRLDSYYLNIVKELSNKFSIGMYMGKFSDKARIKNSNTDRLFLSKCEELGASILKEGKYACKLLLVNQNTVGTEDRMVYLMEHISYENVIVTQLFSQGKGSLENMKRFRMKKLWVYERKVLEGMLKDEKQEDAANGIEITDIEFPYRKYPALDFSGLEIDYLIAMPTKVFRRDKANEAKLLQNMKRLLKSMPKEKTVYVKQHNAKDIESGSMIYSMQSKYALFVKYVYFFLKTGIKKILMRKAKWSDAINDIRITNARMFIEKRSRLLSEITKYHNFNIELFLPFVRDGIITGISSCIFHSFLNRLPVYNCDDQPFTVESPNYNSYKSFYIPSCNGRLEFDPANFDLVRGCQSKHDMIDFIKEELSRE
ncbi:MAG: hypothetical protein HOG49_11925 [Candidatus Scalindua sp.]|jgi:hypothetical protein|nr:hypothetical protein [Candidatus Scalindua sp.]